MAYEGKSSVTQGVHRLTMEDCGSLWMSGVEEVVSFDEQTVDIRTVKGLLSVRGMGLKVDKLEKTTGELTVSGQVSSLEYDQAGTRGGFWSRLIH